MRELYNQRWPAVTRGHKPHLLEKPAELKRFERRCERFYRERENKRVTGFDFSCAGFVIQVGKVYYGETWARAIDWKNMDGDRQNRVLELLPMMEEYLTRRSNIGKGDKQDEQD